MRKRAAEDSAHPATVKSPNSINEDSFNLPRCWSGVPVWRKGLSVGPSNPKAPMPMHRCAERGIRRGFHGCERFGRSMRFLLAGSSLPATGVLLREIAWDAHARGLAGRMRR